MRREHFDEIDSTSAYLKKNYAEKENLTFVDSLFQSKGRGRFDRKWDAEKGDNLLFSVLIKDKETMRDFPKLSILAATTLIEYFESIGMGNVGFKWPNDVYINGKKCVGILLEGVSDGDSLSAIVIGIGVNVNQASFEGLPNATSLYLESGRRQDIESMAIDLFPLLEERIKGLSSKSSRHLEIARSHDVLKGKEVGFLHNGESKRGLVLGISDEDEIVIDCGGQTLKITSGEITFHL